jgi:N-acetylmuramic acid 6-phosphate (MurNAc-6-P) etherase
VGILEKTAGLDHAAAHKLLAAAGGRVPVAMVMAKAGVSRSQAAAALKESQGQVRRAITLAKRGSEFKS